MVEQNSTGTAAVRSAHGVTLPLTLRVLLFAALTAAGAWVEIPNSPVPFTLQTLFVLLAGALLGARAGAASMLVYLGAGAIGLPVFSSFGFGLARLIGPTGGYLLAFPAAAFAVGSLAGERPGIGRLVLSMSAALLIIFACGTIQLRMTLLHDWSDAFTGGFLIFSWWDVVKLAAAASIARAIRPGRAAA
jgi:biotin transport system substrate-specific component